MKTKTSKILFSIIVFLSLSQLYTIQSCDTNKSEPECDTCTVDYKPNIYFFPEKNTQIEVKLKFPLGGKVIKSEPLYYDGWNVNIDQSGLIAGKYNFLFYESTQPDIWQYEQGWCIKKENLEAFFESNLFEYGFGEKEISDFIEYWIPMFTESNYYLIYPQTNEFVDKAIKLSLSIKPDHILRLHYVVKESGELNVDIKAPLIEKFKREGFYITEWGVIF